VPGNAQTTIDTVTKEKKTRGKSKRKLEGQSTNIQRLSQKISDEDEKIILLIRQKREHRMLSEKRKKRGKEKLVLGGKNCPYLFIPQRGLHSSKLLIQTNSKPRRLSGLKTEGEKVTRIPASPEVGSRGESGLLNLAPNSA